MNIEERLSIVNDRVRRAAERSGRDAQTIGLIAISKTFDAATVIEARKAGQHVFGENRAQELVAKQSVVPDVEWHFVGKLQTNKVKQVVGIAELVHSVDSLKLARAISKRAAARSLRQDVLIEVNVAGDERKNGIAPDAVGTLVDDVAGLENIRVRGLMTIPPFPETPEESRPYYKDLAALGATLEGRIGGPVELSMGMTRDFDVAIEEGATLIRVGEAIFGTRDPAS